MIIISGEEEGSQPEPEVSIVDLPMVPKCRVRVYLLLSIEVAVKIQGFGS